MSERAHLLGICGTWQGKRYHKYRTSNYAELLIEALPRSRIMRRGVQPGMTMIRSLLCAGAVAFIAAGSSPAMAFDKYGYGHVWRLSFVKTKATGGASGEYLRNLDANYKRELDEAKREGIILSYKVLQSDDWTADDWSVMLMLELPNISAVEGFDEKMDAITDKVIGEQADKQGDVQRAKIRDYMTIRLAHEVLLK